MPRRGTNLRQVWAGRRRACLGHRFGLDENMKSGTDGIERHLRCSRDVVGSPVAIVTHQNQRWAVVNRCLVWGYDG
jgi:hypothetical protein